ncbi:MAG TPA: hypothetical protein VFI65_24025 [Streptosporangiaceae bacterium]|nr:hypothetical protein [Streptosporangiaceae bacterium]
MIDFDGTIHFYEGSAAMRRSFDLAAQCTGVSTDVLLRKRDIGEDEATMRISSVALAAASFGIQEALAEIGVVPVTVGGLSLGDMVAPAATGAVSRSGVFNMLFSSRHEPASSEPGKEETTAFAYVPAGEDRSPYYEPQAEGVYFGASLGKVRWGNGEAIMLSGYRSALEEFAAQHPEGNVKVRPARACTAAYHSPLRMKAREQMERLLDDLRLEDPAMPVCSSVLEHPVTTAAGVRELLLRNCVGPAYVYKMIAQVMSYEPAMVVTIGPAMAKGMFVFPVPVLNVDSLETLADAADVIAGADKTRLSA